jgi:hypothetical protein
VEHSPGRSVRAVRSAALQARHVSRLQWPREGALRFERRRLRAGSQWSAATATTRYLPRLIIRRKSCMPDAGLLGARHSSADSGSIRGCLFSGGVMTAISVAPEAPKSGRPSLE